MKRYLFTAILSILSLMNIFITVIAHQICQSDISPQDATLASPEWGEGVLQLGFFVSGASCYLSMYGSARGKMTELKIFMKANCLSRYGRFGSMDQYAAFQLSHGTVLYQFNNYGACSGHRNVQPKCNIAPVR